MFKLILKGKLNCHVEEIQILRVCSLLKECSTPLVFTGVFAWKQWSGSGDQRGRKAEWWIGQRYYASATVHLTMLSQHRFEIQGFFVCGLEMEEWRES